VTRYKVGVSVNHPQRTSIISHPVVERYKERVLSSCHLSA